jgi:hypothetical protein
VGAIALVINRCYSTHRLAPFATGPNRRLHRHANRERTATGGCITYLNGWMSTRQSCA